MLPLAGPHQVMNACVAVQACLTLRLSDTAIRTGLQQVDWPGRFQRLCTSPVVVVDVAHNVSGFRQLVWTMDHLYPSHNVTLILGVLKDKDYPGMIRRLPQRLQRLYAVTPDSSRALAAEQLADALTGRPVSVCARVDEAVQAAWQAAGADALICVAGSHYLAAEALEAIKRLTK